MILGAVSINCTQKRRSVAESSSSHLFNYFLHTEGKADAHVEVLKSIRKRIFKSADKCCALMVI